MMFFRHIPLNPGLTLGHSVRNLIVRDFSRDSHAYELLMVDLSMLKETGLSQYSPGIFKELGR
jgi:hypothetical protein